MRNGNSSDAVFRGASPDTTLQFAPCNSTAGVQQFTMSCFKQLLLSGAIALLAGCASGEWTGEKIPYPVSTPYDMSVQARAAYLDGFQQGYRAEKASGISRVETLTGPFVRARQEGFYLGAAQARAELEGAPQVQKH